MSDFDEEFSQLERRFKEGKITEQEFIEGIVKLMTKYNVKIHAKALFSAVRLLKKNRER